MKRLISIAMSLIMAVGIFGSTVTVYGNTYNWTAGYESFLNEQMVLINNNKSNFTQFTLYDINNDKVPELFLKNTASEGSYKVYNFSAEGVKLEKTFVTQGFYRYKDNNRLVASYGGEAGLTYAYYETDTQLSLSEQIFKTRRGNKIDYKTYEWFYYYNNKEVDQEKFDQLFAEKLNQISLAFSDITPANVDEQIYQGVGYIPSDEMPEFNGTRTANGNSAITFANGHSATLKTNSVSDVYGLLLINGKYVTDAFPINAEGVTLIPVRAVGENLDATVSWAPEAGKITIRGSKTIEMYIDKNTALVDGVKVTMDVAPTIVASSTYVPARFVSENLNTEVYFWAGSEELPPIISVESKSIADIRTIDEAEALDKVKFLFKDIKWTASNFIFTKAYMDETVKIQSEGLVAGRYWSITIDKNATQRILIDQFSGQVFSRYETKTEFGIQQGMDASVTAIVETYIG